MRAVDIFNQDCIIDDIGQFIALQNDVCMALTEAKQKLFLKKSQEELQALKENGGRIVLLYNDEGVVVAGYLATACVGLYAAEKFLSMKVALPDYLAEDDTYLVINCALVSPKAWRLNMMDTISLSIDQVCGEIGVEKCLFSIDQVNAVTIDAALDGYTHIIGIGKHKVLGTLSFIFMRGLLPVYSGEQVYSKELADDLSIIELQNYFDLNYVGVGYNYRRKELQLKKLSIDAVSLISES